VRVGPGRALHQAVACPRCNCAAQVRALGRVEADHCPACHGLWLDAGEMALFREMAQDEDIAGDVRSLLASLRAPAPPPASGYLKCPVCRNVMNRINFKRSSGILLDRCKSHGTWLDHDDALRLLELMAGDGERELDEKNVRRQKTELDDKLRALSAKQHELSAQRALHRRHARYHTVLDFLDFF
jgi:Zn-finger nucleic acid-binding protein